MPTDVCPARTTAAMLLMMKIKTSCPNIAKPHVRRSCFYSVGQCRYEWQSVSRAWASKLFCKVGFVSGFVCLANVLAFALPLLV